MPIDEHFEPNFNAVWPSAIGFQRPDKERRMFCIYLALTFFVAGIGVWIAGSVVDKKKKKLTKSKRKKYQKLADKLGTAARIIFILCAVSFIFGFILLLGSQSSNMQPL
jgi:Cu/Ag efflux pump CusA